MRAGGQRRSTTLDPDSSEHVQPASPEGEAGDLVGRRLLHFRVTERLGAGGMGIVYKALDEKLRRPVALKVLAPRYLVDDRNKDLIFREARSAAAVHHPNITVIYEVHDTPEAAFLAMELVVGESLRARIERGRLALDEALGIARQMAEGLACAHAAGVVHRDLKPENAMITAGEQVKLLDFGLAKVAALADPLVGTSGPRDALPAALAPTIPAHEASAEHGRVMGTPAYMAPEQARGGPADARTDVFAFGAVLFEMLTGKPPFVRSTNVPSRWGGPESEDWRVRRDCAPLRAVAGDAGAKLVYRCIALDPAERYADATELRSALEQAATNGRRTKWWALGGAALGVVVAAATAPAWSRRVRPARRRRYRRSPLHRPRRRASR
jgi:serine/threonine protein kinase